MRTFIPAGITAILLLSISVSAMVINEIMYNPEGNDNNREWVEIYSAESTNLSGWRFREAGINHGLTLSRGSWLLAGYAVIADDAETFLLNYPSFNGTLFDSIWGSLHNSGELLAIVNSSLVIIDEVNYSSSWGGDNNGNSLERLANGSWTESITNGGTPGMINSAPCTPLITNTTWSGWGNATECLLNDTYIQQRSFVQHDLRFCIANETFRETHIETCDFCIPSWRAVNASCREDDSTVQWHNDSNGCYGATSLISDMEGQDENVTYALSCDYNADGIIGSIADINFSNSSIEALTVARVNETISFRQNGAFLLWFSFPNQTFLLSDVFLERQSNDTETGYLLINGIPAVKTVYIERNTSGNAAPGNAVCIKDADVFSVGNISASCTAQNETIVRCDGNPVGNPVGNYNYTCRRENSTYIVSGVRHSGIMEFTIPEPEPEPAPPPSGSGGSSRRDDPDEEAAENLLSEATETNAAEEETALNVQEEPADADALAARVFDIELDLNDAENLNDGEDAENSEERESAAENALTGAAIGVPGKNNILYAAAFGALVLVLAGALYWRKKKRKKKKHTIPE